MDKTQNARPPDGRARLGSFSAAGPVRADNQDRVHAGQAADADVLVVADGLGGLPRGGEAAEFAAHHAFNRLKRELPVVLVAAAEGVRTLLLSTVWSAGACLAREAGDRGWTGLDAGFRTTLVLVVALPDAYVAAWIGDGGAFVLRAGGETVALVEPHKDPAVPSLLDASLGPVTDGRPSWAIAPREAGDILAVATDGIADHFDAGLADRVRARLAECRGRAGRAARLLVEELGAAQDGTGTAVFSDNLTLALLVTEGP